MSWNFIGFWKARKKNTNEKIFVRDFGNRSSILCENAIPLLNYKCDLYFDEIHDSKIFSICR